MMTDTEITLAAIIIIALTLAAALGFACRRMYRDQTVLRRCVADLETECERLAHSNAGYKGATTEAIEEANCLKADLARVHADHDGIIKRHGALTASVVKTIAVLETKGTRKAEGVAVLRDACPLVSDEAP